LTAKASKANAALGRFNRPKDETLEATIAMLEERKFHNKDQLGGSLKELEALIVLIKKILETRKDRQRGRKRTHKTHPDLRKGDMPKRRGR